MDELVVRLRRHASARGLELTSTATMFDLMAAGCSECCTNYVGGNGTCPPPPKKLE